LPLDPAGRIALVGRSNVGKSSLINALTRQRIARTSAAPGKTRLVNLYRVRLAGTGLPAGTLYLMDLPGFGYARGGGDAAREFDAITRELFAAPRGGPDAALLLVDARHPGLGNDVAAREWLAGTGLPFAVVATKIDQLTRSERKRTATAFAQPMKGPVQTVSAVTGEGLDDLWKQILRLCSGPGAARTPPSSSSRA
jgi:GTP-binding protein